MVKISVLVELRTKFSEFSQLFYNKMREGNAILNNNNHQHSATAQQATKNNPAGLRPWMSRISKISPDELRLEISFTIRGDQFANSLSWGVWIFFGMSHQANFLYSFPNVCCCNLKEMSENKLKTILLYR